MKSRNLLRNTLGVSSMYDAVLFIVMVSLSGVVLLPALQSDVAVETSVEEHREHVADEALNAFLVSRVDRFNYRVCGDIIDDVADSVGINTSNNELYRSITEWLIGREQIHKTYANIISEDLACQFRMPFSILGSNRINIFTGDYDRQLEEEVTSFFSAYLGDKYNFNLTARWHPIKGVGFGGEIFIGERVPHVDSYVAKSFITMPYSPKIEVPGVGEIVFSRYWFESFIEDVPELNNISGLINGYDPSITGEELKWFKHRLACNLSLLAEGFLFNNLKNETGSIVFPGVLNVTLQYGFSRIKTMVDSLTVENVTGAFGESIGMADSFFGVFTDADNPLIVNIEKELTNTIIDIIESLGFPIDPDSLLTSALNELENQTRNFVVNLVSSILDSYIEDFIDSTLKDMDTGQLVDPVESVFDWLFERISISRAEITLTVWAVRG